LIEVSEIYKYYNEDPAVRGISFSITENGVYGFLGPNGAGKSTTMNIITGCLAASSGSVKIDGHDIFEEPEKAKAGIGYLPEQPPLYMDMTPYEYLKFVAEARGVKKAELKDKISYAMDVTGITPIKDRLIKNLSKGYKQRVGIAQTMLGNPGIIILDEPTVGLDPKQITEIRELVRNLGKNHIVLFSSHILSEVQTISDHIIIIARGQLIADSRVHDLDSILKKEPVIKLRLKGEGKLCMEMLSAAADSENIRIISEEDGISNIEISTETPEKTAEQLFFACADKRIPIIEMTAVKPTLEEAFLELTERRDTYTDDSSAQENAIKLAATNGGEAG